MKLLGKRPWTVPLGWITRNTGRRSFVINVDIREEIVEGFLLRITWGLLLPDVQSDAACAGKIVMDVRLRVLADSVIGVLKPDWKYADLNSSLRK